MLSTLVRVPAPLFRWIKTQVGAHEDATEIGIPAVGLDGRLVRYVVKPDTRNRRYKDDPRTTKSA